VLVVVSDADCRCALEHGLHQAGIEHAGVAGAAAAKAWLETAAPSVLILEFAEPHSDADDVLAALRASTKCRSAQVSIVAIVESSEAETRATAAGASCILRMPLEPASAVEHVRRIAQQDSDQNKAVKKLVDQSDDATQLTLDLTDALAASLDLHPILVAVAQRISKAAHSRSCHILLLDEGQAHIIATTNGAAVLDVAIPLEGYPDLHDALASTGPFVIDTTDAPPLLGILQRHGDTVSSSSLVLMPIVHDNKPIAVVVLDVLSESCATGGPLRHETAMAVAAASAPALVIARTARALREENKRQSFACLEAERRTQLLKRYAAFFESGANGLIVSDLEGQILFTNARARTITGLSETALRSRTIDRLVIERDRARIRGVIEGFATGTYPEHVEAGLERSDGTQLALRIHFGNVIRDDGTVVMSLRDITQDHAVQAELRRAKDRLVRVADGSVNAIMFVDVNGVVTLFNRAAEQCLGWKAEHVVGKLTVFDVLPEEETTALMRMLLASDLAPSHVDTWDADTPSGTPISNTSIPHTSGAQPANADTSSPETLRNAAATIADRTTRLRSASGEMVPVTLRATLVFDGDRQTGAVVIWDDMRSMLRVEARLAAAHVELESRERQAIIAHLAGAAAHELNQPLTSILGYAELLKRRVLQDPSACDAAERIMSDIARMAEIVRKIGRITRYETKSYVGTTKILDLDRTGCDADHVPDRGGD